MTLRETGAFSFIAKRRSIMNKNEIILFETDDNEVSLQVQMQDETVWLSRNQMAELFDRDVKTIGKHINNAIREELAGQVVVAKFATTTQHGAISGKTQTHMTEFYNLDVIISVGYRVKSQRGVEFRRWANSVLKDYILRGYAVNDRRISQLGQIVQIMKRAEDQLDAQQVLSVVESYSAALDMLDDYDHQTMSKPKGNKATYVLSYDECREVIDKMKFASDSDLFGNEKDDSFKGSIGAIYQSFDGKDLYPSLEEKAANLLYFVTKNHSFSDGNKRIAATMFLYFLDKNKALFVEGSKRIADFTLVALTIMIAESKPEEKEMMVKVIMNCMV
jgi:prophage maintenance system killer protein